MSNSRLGTLGDGMALEAGTRVPRAAVTAEGNTLSALVLGDFATSCPPYTYFKRWECLECDALSSNRFCYQNGVGECPAGSRIKHKRTVCARCAWYLTCDGTARVGLSRAGFVSVILSCAVPAVAAWVMLRRRRQRESWYAPIPSH